MNAVSGKPKYGKLNAPSADKYTLLSSVSKVGNREPRARFAARRNIEPTWDERSSQEYPDALDTSKRGVKSSATDREFAKKCDKNYCSLQQANWQFGITRFAVEKRRKVSAVNSAQHGALFPVAT